MSNQKIYIIQELENNHQFQAMKEGGVWKPICKKCGITNRDKHDKCSF